MYTQFKKRVYKRFIKKVYKKRNKDIISNSDIKLKVGLTLDLDFHLSDKWTVTLTSYRINEIIRQLNCVILDSQQDYDEHKNDLDVVISGEPGWGSPRIAFVKNKPVLKYASMSDPHSKVSDWQQYFLNNDFSFVLAYYYYPTIFHLKHIPRDKIVHFPWAVPDEFVNRNNIDIGQQDYILLFGAIQHESYETRKWCQGHDFIKYYHFSGVENRALVGKRYFEWLRRHDAAIAATSLRPEWRYVVAKYFEIPTQGSLLFAQEAEDLELLGFEDNKNCVIFNQTNFERKTRFYLNNKDAYKIVREEGRRLIMERHTISSRIHDLKAHIYSNL